MGFGELLAANDLIKFTSSSAEHRHRQYVVAVVFLEPFGLRRQTDREKEKAFYSAEKVSRESQQGKSAERDTKQL